MTLFRALALGLAACLAFPAFAQDAPAAASGDAGWLYRGSDIARDPSWRFGTLANGLRYAIRRNARPAGQVSIRVRIDAGSLEEADDERGWAHFIEHMAFRGTEHYPGDTARQTWQQLGASFGSDTNAQTDATDTVYRLDLPNADRASLDTSLTVLADMMARARIDPDAVAAERPVVLAEKARRSELAARFQAAARPLIYAGLRYAARDPIGTDATLNAATAAGLRAFYHRWYRPERTVVVMVGDADPAMMEDLIRARFGDWRGIGPAPADPDFGQPAAPASNVVGFVYPGVPTTASVGWVRPHDDAPLTIARERMFTAETLAAAILNRRLEAHARGRSAFLGASIGTAHDRDVADTTLLQVRARDDDWRPALNEAYGILADALATPPDADEIDREIRNIRTAVEAAVQTEPTALSQSFANRMVGAIDNGSLVASAATVRANFERNAPLMTPAAIEAALHRLFAGSGPRLLLATPRPVAGGETALAQALAAARAAAPLRRAAERRVTFDDLPALGPAGREVSRREIADMGVTIVTFANGATLTFKHTEFDHGVVEVRLRFGRGLAGLPADRPALAWAQNLVAPSGVADLDLEAMQRMLTGRRIGMGFSIDDDAFVLGSQTSAPDLPDELRLLATKLADPGWDPRLFARARQASLDGYDLQFASAAARAGRELQAFLRPGDRRVAPVARDALADATADQFRAFYAPLLAEGPVHAIIVGDVSLDDAVAAMLPTVAALPARADPPAASDPAAIRPPAPDPRPATFTHGGDPDQAFALIGWTTLGGLDDIRDERALALAANIFQARLFEQLREREGAAYAPNTTHQASATFPNWGAFFAAAEVRPANVPTFFRVARAIVADLAAHPVAADEFARAQNPVISGIERRLATNAYWVAALENWDSDPRQIVQARDYLSDYRGLTPEDIRRAVATFVTDQGDWSMVVLPDRRTSQTAAGEGAAPSGHQ
jgi:zinc protease